MIRISGRCGIPTPGISRGFCRLSVHELSSVEKRDNRHTLHARKELDPRIGGRLLPYDDEPPKSLEHQEAITSISKLGRQRRWQEALSVYASFHDPGVKMRTSTLDAISKSRELAMARRLFGETVVKRVADYNIMIALLGRFRRISEVEDMLSEMKSRGLQPTEVTFGSLITSYGIVKDMAEVMRVFQDMQASAVAPTVVTYAAVLSACGKAGDKLTAVDVLARMETSAIPPNIGHFTSTIAACAQSQDFELANKILAKMRQSNIAPDVVTFTALIGCASGPDAVQATDKIVIEMINSGIMPDSYVYNQLIQVAFKSSNFVRARELLAEMDTKGLARNRETELRTHQLSRLEAEAEAEQSRPQPSESSHNLPPGWCAAVDPSSSTMYYWQVADPSGTTTWEDPRHSKTP